MPIIDVGYRLPTSDASGWIHHSAAVSFLMAARVRSYSASIASTFPRCPSSVCYGTAQLQRVTAQSCQRGVSNYQLSILLHFTNVRILRENFFSWAWVSNYTCFRSNRDSEEQFLFRIKILLATNALSYKLLQCFQWVGNGSYYDVTYWLDITSELNFSVLYKYNLEYGILYLYNSHRWGPEFASRSLHVGFVVDEPGSG